MIDNLIHFSMGEGSQYPTITVTKLETNLRFCFEFLVSSSWRFLSNLFPIALATVPEGSYKEHPNPPCRYSLLALLSICSLKHSPRILLLYFLHLNDSCSNTMAGDALMLGITGLMMLPMLGELFPQGQDDATVRITVGTYNPYQFDNSNLVGGPVPNVALFDVNGERIGFRRGAGHGEMKSGEGTDITIAPYADNDKADPEYVSISASSSDAVCIVAVTVVGADTNGAGGAQQWGWNGDFGKMCGQVWYPSRKSITDANAEQIRPACIWISNDGRFPMGFTRICQILLATLHLDVSMNTSRIIDSSATVNPVSTFTAISRRSSSRNFTAPQSSRTCLLWTPRVEWKTPAKSWLMVIPDAHRRLVTK